jgi:prepilin-type N-terminal cleavage/methylation domain-containing protein
MRAHFVRGMSLVEMLVAIAVVGILAAVALPSLGRVVPGSKAAIAREVVETLNTAVNKYSQLHGGEIRRVAADGASGAEELAIVRAMQWDSPTDPEPGAPYMRTDYNPATSSSTSDYRAVWNGVFFELKGPGEAGAGLVVDFDGSDVGQPVTFPSGFVPLSGF